MRNKDIVRISFLLGDLLVNFKRTAQVNDNVPPDIVLLAYKELISDVNKIRVEMEKMR